jgi:hypothetical protein
VRTRFILYFDDEAPADEAGSILDRRGFDVRVLHPDEHVEQWAVHALKDVPGRIVSPRLRLTERRLSRLASKLGGEYDGNEVEVEPKPHCLAVWQKSFDYYKKQAWQAKTGYRVSETAILIVAAAIPASAAFTGDRRIPAVLGAVTVVLTGVRQVFRWRENWQRFTTTCALLQNEYDFYVVGDDKYADENRDQRLVRRVREIEMAETTGWVALLNAGKDADRGKHAP